MSNLQTEWSEAELIATHPVAAPLFADGRRCHGGFNDDGDYVSPRTLGRWPAIRNWQEQHAEHFETAIVDAPLAQWPEPYPNVSQSKYLLSQGVFAPTAALLTRIGTVEGFGGLIREVGIGDLQPHFVDPIEHTALSHLERGLFETHARDEVGFAAEAGHKEMWFAARDIAFEHAYSADDVNAMLRRLGFATAGSDAASHQAQTAAPPQPERICTEIDGGLEAMLRFMIALMFIEVSAFHVFAWAAEVLSDSNLVAGDGEAARLVSYIRSDETPHVAYLQTALTEVRDRTLRTCSGGAIPGSEIIQRMWDAALAESLGPRQRTLQAANLGEVEFALAANPRRDAILEHFHALATA